MSKFVPSSNSTSKFNFRNRKQAEACLRSLSSQGFNAKLKQLETSFQLRIRRKGVRQQFLTFDTFGLAEQARLRIESDLSVGIIRDYSSAAQNTLRVIMVRYRDEVVPSHKGGGDVESNRIDYYAVCAVHIPNMADLW